MTSGPRVRHLVVPFDLWAAERALARLDVADRAELAARMSAPTPATARQAEVSRLVLALADKLDPHARRSANANATHMAEAARAFAPQAAIHARRGSAPAVEPERTIWAIMQAWTGYRGEDGAKSPFPSVRTLRDILAAR